MRLFQVDVFTRRIFAGNPAGVVLDAERLSDGQMVAIAREINLSETAFVFPSTDSDVVPVRFFTPTHEVPVCGHATLGAHFVRAKAEDRAEAAQVRQISKGVEWDVRWERRENDTMVLMRQGPIEYGAALDEALVEEVSGALHLARGDLAAETPVQVISTGHAKVMVPVSSPAALRRADPQREELVRISQRLGVAGFFLFARDHEGRGTSTVCRMFAPAIGVDEDPVNGSGHGPLAAYLLMLGGDSADLARNGFWSRMGENLGRCGRIWVQACGDGTSVEVGGYVTPVFSGTIDLGGTTE